MPYQISSFCIALLLAAPLLVGCALDSRTSNFEPAPEVGQGGALGGGGSAGEGSQGEPAAVGGSGPQSGPGAGSPEAPGRAATPARPSDCASAEPLPDTIDEDRTIGPGCVRIRRTTVISEATLTVLPGTTVLMEAAAYLDADAQLVAIGTADQPIVFTSSSAAPLPGDWQCVRVGQNASNSQLEHVIFEYGGQPCGATGAGNATTLDVAAPLRGIRDVTVRDSLNHGIMLSSSAAVRAFSNNHFARNGDASIQLDAAQILQLGTGNSFEDADDYIEVVAGSTLSSNGTWLNQGVPFRVQSMVVAPGLDVTVAAGVRVEMLGGTIDAFNANFNLEGTEAEPVVFTSAQKNPKPGDWGCLSYSYTSVTPHIDHAIFEYAGSGSGCLGSSTKAALVAPNSSNVTNTIFRYIDGVGISARDNCNVNDWCQNQFVEVALGPFECEGTFMPCPD
ncbi:MAG: hypothetical protein ABI895_26315 [Deltaproteobacteria bacterium]